MRLLKVAVGFLLALVLFTSPVLAQENPDHHDTNSKTKKELKKLGDKTKDTADTAADKTKEGAKATAGATEKAGDKVTGKIDINSASKEDLMKLEGIGEALSQKIIDNRPYRAKSDLVSKKVIPQATYEKIRDKIIAHRATSSKPTAATKSKKTATAAGSTATTPK